MKFLVPFQDHESEKYLYSWAYRSWEKVSCQKCFFTTKGNSTKNIRFQHSIFLFLFASLKQKEFPSRLRAMK